MAEPSEVVAKVVARVVPSSAAAEPAEEAEPSEAVAPGPESQPDGAFWLLPQAEPLEQRVLARRVLEAQAAKALAWGAT